MRKIQKIIIHCSATPEGYPFTATDIDRWHKQRGFRCIGYHYVILLDGTIERGRPEEEVGAHCSGQNKYSIGICYIGGLDLNLKPQDTRTEAQKAAMAKLLKDLHKRYPRATLHGHNEFSHKACPCFHVKTEL